MATNKSMYKLWERLIAQCNDPAHHLYPRYGAKGIDVCKRWKEDFENFVQDMGFRPKKRHLIRRKPKRNFTPSNCYWGTDLDLRNKQIIEGGKK